MESERAARQMEGRHFAPPHPVAAFSGGCCLTPGKGAGQLRGTCGACFVRCLPLDRVDNGHRARIPRPAALPASAPPARARQVQQSRGSLAAGHSGPAGTGPCSPPELTKRALRIFPLPPSPRILVWKGLTSRSLPRASPPLSTRLLEMHCKRSDVSRVSTDSLCLFKWKDSEFPAPGQLSWVVLAWFCRHLAHCPVRAPHPHSCSGPPSLGRLALDKWTNVAQRGDLKAFVENASAS